jgi:hypothetical protein
MPSMSEITVIDKPQAKLNTGAGQSTGSVPAMIRDAPTACATQSRFVSAFVFKPDSDGRKPLRPRWLVVAPAGLGSISSMLRPFRSFRRPA